MVPSCTRARVRTRLLAAVLGSVLALVALPATYAEVACNDADSGASTQELEERQYALDSVDAPQLQDPTEASDDATAVPADDSAVVEDYAAAEPSTQKSGGPVDLRVNHLTYATNADRRTLRFSWNHAVSQAQTAYEIRVYLRSASTDPVATSGMTSSSEQSSVTVPGLGDRLEDNQLYYWDVTVRYADGTSRTSARVPFVTAVASQWQGTALAWTAERAVSTLTRAQVTVDRDVERALLSVTALDTEASLRHVFNVYVNGVEQGIGPTRRSGTTVYYNSYDVTDAIRTGDNVLGLFSYSQAVGSGVLMQLTTYYSDGSSKIIYSSARDTAVTLTRKMDEAVYGTSNRSIGTSYYRELAQDADTTRFPYGWQEPDNQGIEAGWATAAAVAWPVQYTLRPSIVENATRRTVEPSSVARNRDGSYTVAFAREVVGDVQLTATAPTRTAVRITAGEELSGGEARYQLRTGNVYDETWTFQGTDVTFTGFSLKSFRYLTIYGYPGTLTTDRVAAVETSIPVDLSAGSFSSGSELLDGIDALSRHSYSQYATDTVTDSVTRERRPYEGDLLIFQALAYQVSDDDMLVRNTWNYLLDNPTQYTEYRLMAAIGVYEDYLRTGDAVYVSEVYDRLRAQVDATVSVDGTTGLVWSTGATVDLVDWPRSELSGYDVSTTTYKTVVNAVAYGAYQAMSELAAASGHGSDAGVYTARAAAVRSAMVSRLYDPNSGAFSDGLTSGRQRVSHSAIQNSYMALAFGAYTDQAMADRLVEAIEREGRQTAGSIYAAFFLYRGLYASNHGDFANALLQRTSASDERTYSSVLTTLGATIAPEAWSVTSKPNMTFSHPWGAGGGAAMLEGIAGARATSPGCATYQLSVQVTGLTDVSTTTLTSRGSVTTTVHRDDGALGVTTTVPGGTNARLRLVGVTAQDTVTLDGHALVPGKDGTDLIDDVLWVSLTAGSHTVDLEPALALTAHWTDGRVVTAGDGETLGWSPSDDDPSGLTMGADGEDTGITIAVRSATTAWSAPASVGAQARTSDATGITAIQMTTSDAEQAKTVYYRVLTAGHGWLGWASEGQTAGTTSGTERVLAIEVRLLPAGTPPPTGNGRPASLDPVRSDLLIIRRANQYFIKNSLSGGAADLVVPYGRPGDVVLVGDWDGDGVDTLAVRRGNEYFIKNSLSGGAADLVVPYGRPGDAVLVGKVRS